MSLTQAVEVSAMRYPTPDVVEMSGGPPSLRRSRLRVTVTVLVKGSAFSSHTCSRRPRRSGIPDLNRHSIVLAQEAARTHEHDFIGTEHLLLGLLGEPRGLAYGMLIAKTGSEQRVRDAVAEAMPPVGEKAPRGHIAFRPESEEAIDEARRASADLGHGRVGTEHTLLGLIRTEDSPAARILRSLGFAPDELRATVEAEVAERSAAGDLH